MAEAKKKSVKLKLTFIVIEDLGQSQHNIGMFFKESDARQLAFHKANRGGAFQKYWVETWAHLPGDPPEKLSGCWRPPQKPEEPEIPKSYYDALAQYELDKAEYGEYIETYGEPPGWDDE